MTDVRRLSLIAEPFEDTSLLHFPALRAVPGFAHMVTTRPWNMAVHRGPGAHLAVARRRRLCDHLGLPFEGLTCADQIHSAHVLRILPADVGAGRESRATAMRFLDGMVCDLPGVALMQFSADCPMVLVVEPRRRVFGTAHASWRGTLARITQELVRQMRREFDIEPTDLLAAVSPCAGPDEYEVGEEVFRIATAQWSNAEQHFALRDGKRYFDLRSANVAQLIACGVRSENISVAVECTLSDERFYSHRRDGADTGRFAIIAGFRI